MQIEVIRGATRVIGESQGYIGLPLRDITVFDAAAGRERPAMETAWSPTAEELEALNRGEPVILQLLGNRHPPVMIGVGDAVPDMDREALCNSFTSTAVASIYAAAGPLSDDGSARIEDLLSSLGTVCISIVLGLSAEARSAGLTYRQVFEMVTDPVNDHLADVELAEAEPAGAA